VDRPSARIRQRPKSPPRPFFLHSFDFHPPPAQSGGCGALTMAAQRFRDRYLPMTDDTRVLYNGDCPVCSYEINHYAAYSGREGLPIRFEDLNTAVLNDWGLTRDSAARRLYLLKEGQMHSGIPAFIILWRDMPKYRWMARIVSLPCVHGAACLTYDYVLAPLIYRWHVRRQRRFES